MQAVALISFPAMPRIPAKMMKAEFLTAKKINERHYVKSRSCPGGPRNEKYKEVVSIPCKGPAKKKQKHVPDTRPRYPETAK